MVMEGHSNNTGPRLTGRKYTMMSGVMMAKPFLSWLTKNKLKSTDKWVPDLRCVTDTSTFRDLSKTGYTSDQVVERAVEDGWFYVNEDQPPELTFQDVLDKIEGEIYA